MSPEPPSAKTEARPTRTLQGPDVVRIDRGQSFVESQRIVLRGTKLPSGCDYSFEHRLKSGRVSGGTVEYDPTTCDFVVAIGRDVGSVAATPFMHASEEDSVSVDGARWPTASEKARFTRGPSGTSIGEFRILNPFDKLGRAASLQRPIGPKQFARPNDCPQEFDGYKYAYNTTYFIDPIYIQVNKDSVNAEWSYINDVCIQTATRQFWVFWYTPTGWTKTFAGWTSAFTIPYPYHSVTFENTAVFTNYPFCVFDIPTYSEYPQVRILGHDDGYANFYDSAYSWGDCSFFLAKNWDHYVSPG